MESMSLRQALDVPESADKKEKNKHAYFKTGTEIQVDKIQARLDAGSSPSVSGAGAEAGATGSRVEQL